MIPADLNCPGKYPGLFTYSLFLACISVWSWLMMRAINMNTIHEYIHMFVLLLGSCLHVHVGSCYLLVLQCYTISDLPGGAKHLKTLPQEMVEVSWNDRLRYPFGLFVFHDNIYTLSCHTCSSVRYNCILPTPLCIKLFSKKLNQFAINALSHWILSSWSV